VKRDVHTVAVNDLRATAAWTGASWGVSCWEHCPNIVGYRNERAALLGAMAHLIWHVNGKPTCRDCGAWLAYRTAKRCRKGTCEAT
jgi:hypothetical protein